MKRTGADVETEWWGECHKEAQAGSSRRKKGSTSAIDRVVNATLAMQKRTEASDVRCLETSSPVRVVMNLSPGELSGLP